MAFENGSTNDWNEVQQILMTQILKANGQHPSSSTQLKFEYNTKYSINYFDEGGGFIIDDRSRRIIGSLENGEFDKAKGAIRVGFAIR